MEKICVVIPTNRFFCIEKIIKDSIIPYSGKLFVFEIHDSSDNNKIKELVDSVIKTHKLNLSYKSYPVEISADNKAIMAIEGVSTSYFWLMGDGNLVDFNHIESILIKENFNEYQLTNVDIDGRRGHLNQDADKKINIIYEEKDWLLYCQKYFSRLTYWGAQIVNTEFYHAVFDFKIIDKYIEREIPWWIAFSLLELIERNCNQTVKLGYIYTYYISYNPQKKDHWWTHDERYYVYVFEKINEGFSVLPGIFEKIEYQAISFFRKDALMSNSYLIFLRSINVINYKWVKKYKNSIRKIPSDYIKLRVLCFLPQWFAKILEHIKRAIKFLKNFFYRRDK